MAREDIPTLQRQLIRWRKQYQDTSTAILNCVINGWDADQTYGFELSRLSWLIGKVKEQLRMTRTMYDSTTPENIPAGAQIVCYYPHAWGSNLSAHHNALQVRIDNHGNHADDCHVLDVESGAATNAIAAEWVASWHKLHPDGMNAVNGWIRRPVLYTSTANLAALKTAVNNPNVDYWAAQWDGSTVPIAGCFARQYADHGPHGENYDMSLVYDDTWGVKPAPVTPPPGNPPPAGGGSMMGMLVWGSGPGTTGSGVVYSYDGGKTWAYVGTWPMPGSLEGKNVAALAIWGQALDQCAWREVHSSDYGKTWR